MFWRAIDLLTDEQIRSMVDTYIRLDHVLVDPDADPAGPLEQVREFHAQSVARTYFDSFEVNWRNSNDTSDGTTIFIAEFHRMVDLVRGWSDSAESAQVVEALDLLLDLLHRIDEGCDVIFLADEAGAWQVHTNWRVFLPVYFSALAGTADPATFAEKALARVNYYDVRNDRERWLEAAITAGNEEQARPFARRTATRKGTGDDEGVPQDLARAV